MSKSPCLHIVSHQGFDSCFDFGNPVPEDLSIPNETKHSVVDTSQGGGPIKQA